MVVDHQHIDAAAAGVGDRIVAHSAAIERDDQRRPRVDQLVHGGDVGAVTLEDTVGNMDLRLDAEMPQVSSHQGAGTCSIDIIIPEQRHPFVVGDRCRKTRRKGVHVGQHRGIRHQGADRRREEGLRLLGGDAPPRHYARKDLRQAGALADGSRGPGGVEIEPVQPGAPGHGFLHIEEERLRIGHRRRGNRKHLARSRAGSGFCGQIGALRPARQSRLSGCARPGSSAPSSTMNA